MAGAASTSSANQVRTDPQQSEGLSSALVQNASAGSRWKPTLWGRLSSAGVSWTAVAAISGAIFRLIVGTGIDRPRRA